MPYTGFEPGTDHASFIDCHRRRALPESATMVQGEFAADFIETYRAVICDRDQSCPMELPSIR